MKQSRVRKRMNENWAKSLAQTNPELKQLCEALKSLAGKYKFPEQTLTQ